MKLNNILTLFFVVCILLSGCQKNATEPADMNVTEAENTVLEPEETSNAEGTEVPETESSILETEEPTVPTNEYPEATEIETEPPKQEATAPTDEAIPTEETETEPSEYDDSNDTTDIEM